MIDFILSHLENVVNSTYPIWAVFRAFFALFYHKMGRILG
jgi:hypothetical protein